VNLNEHYREWRDWPPCYNQISNIQKDVERLHFYREKNSHNGIWEFQSLKELLAKQVDQDFLEQICSINSLEYLEMEVVTAVDINKLQELPKLRYLKIYGLRKATDFSCLRKIKTLRKLFIENAKHLNDLEFLDPGQRLVALGIEGSIYTNQKIASLQPLSGIESLEAIFMSSVHLRDKNLDYLAHLPNLKYFSCARFAPKSSFESLRKLMPSLTCNWCDKYET
jgi:hypothetical protein